MRDAQLLADEAEYCSFGDTVHYADPPKIFARCEGSYLFDSAGVPYLDLQMWYSAVNFGYANARLNAVMKHQLDTLPQLASQYLHPTKIELAKAIAQDAQREICEAFGLDRVAAPADLLCRHGLNAGALDQLRTHVLKLVLQFNLLRDRDVLRHDRREECVAAFGP